MVPLSIFVILPLTKLVRIVTRRLLSVESCLECIEKFKVDFLFVNPTMLDRLLQSSLVEEANLSSLNKVFSVGAICHPDLRIKFKEKFPGKRLYSCYGSTEVLFVWPSLSHSYQGYSVGHQIANTEIKIVDDDGNNLGVDEMGEIRAKLNYPVPVRFSAKLVN